MSVFVAVVAAVVIVMVLQGKGLECGSVGRLRGDGELGVTYGNVFFSEDDMMGKLCFPPAFGRFPFRTMEL